MNKTIGNNDFSADTEKGKILHKIKGKIFIGDKENDICVTNKLNCSNLALLTGRKGGLYGSFDCGFLKSDLSMVKRTIYDASIEARILCALSLCTAFFGVVAVYFLLLVLHHYNNDIYDDFGKSIFKGFNGFNKGLSKKDIYKDPAMKKRKLKAEVDLNTEDFDYSANKVHNANDVGNKDAKKEEE